MEILRRVLKINQLSIALSSLSAFLFLAPSQAFAAPGDEADVEPIVAVGTAILDFIEGPFGALILIVAGLVAIISAAMGAYRAAMSCLVIAIGAFILRSFITLFWGELF